MGGPVCLPLARIPRPPITRWKINLAKRSGGAWRWSVICWSLTVGVGLSGLPASLLPSHPFAPTTCCCTLPLHHRCLLPLTLATAFYHHLQSLSFTKASLHHFLPFPNRCVSYYCSPSITSYHCSSHTVFCHHRPATVSIIVSAYGAPDPFCLHKSSSLLSASTLGHYSA